MVGLAATFIFAVSIARARGLKGLQRPLRLGHSFHRRLGADVVWELAASANLIFAPYPIEGEHELQQRQHALVLDGEVGGVNSPA